MTDERRITPGNLARVALADVDDGDSVVYWDASEPVATARTKRITVGDLRAAVLRSPVVVGVDPDPLGAAVFRVGGDSRLGGSAVIDADADVGGALTVGGAANIVGALAVGSTTNFHGIVYTWPAAQTGNYFLRTDGAGALSWASPIGATGLDDLNDVTITAASLGQVLRWSGAQWVNSTDGSALTALPAGNLASGTVPNGRLNGAYTGVVGLGILTADLQFDDALHDIGSGGKRPRDLILSRNATIGGAVTAASFAGDGSLLTALSGTQVTTGTVAAARLATHDLITAHTAGGLSVGQVVRASGAATFAWAVLQFADLGGVPTTIAGYGITDAYTKTISDARFAPIVHTHTAADITAGTLSVTRGGTGVSNPTLGNLYLGAGAGAMTALAPGAVAGYVRSDGSTWARVSGLAFADLTGTPTTLGGYGITDAYTKTQSDALYAVAGGSDTFTQITVSRAAGNARIVRLATGGVARWDLAADSGTESGANAGSAFLLAAYDDGGLQIDTPITITRASTGKIAFARHITASTDAAFDLGSGNRFRDLTLSRNAVIGGDVTVSGTLTVNTITTTSLTATALTGGTVTFTTMSGGGATVSTLHATAAATLDTTLGVTGATTLSTLHTTGATVHDSTVAVAGDFSIATNKFTVAAASGNTAIAGTLSAAGTTVSTLHATAGVTFDVALTIPNGGTGVASFTAGDLPFYAAGTALSAVAIGTASKVLRSTGTAPAWSTATFPNTATSGDLMVATGANAWGPLAIGANLRVLQSNGAAAAWVANLDLGSGTLSAGASTFSTVHATGAVTMDSTATVAGLTSSDNLTVNGAAATDRGFRVTTAGSLRWFSHGDSVAESGANAGTAWRLSAYDDSGVAIDDPIVVTRASGGTVFIQRPSNFTGNVEFGSDAAYDIGATNRPRDFRLSRNALIGGTLGVTGVVSLTVALTLANGGTGLASYTAGDMLYFAAGSLFSKLAIGGNKTILQSNGTTPVWSANIDIGAGTVASGAHVVTSTSANAFTVGPNGTSNPVFNIDASTASQAAGLSLTGAAAAGTVALVVTSSGAAANLTVNAKGTGTIGVGTTSTGIVTISAVTFNATAVANVSTLAMSGALSGATTGAFSSTVTLSGVTDATTSTTGILQIAGGVGIVKSVFIGAALDVGTTSHHAGAATFDSTINGVTLTTNALTFGAGSTTITAGTGASRTLIFRTTTSGSTATTALTLNADQTFTFAQGGSVNGNLVAGVDASYDIGASGATRFRDFFLSRNASIGGTATISGTTHSIGKITADAGILISAGTLQLGGTTASQAAISYSGTEIRAVLGDSSAYAPFHAASLTIESGGITVTAGTTAVQALTATGITLGNGQYLKGTRNTGGLVLNLLGYDAGTDDISMTSSGNFLVKNGGGGTIYTLGSTGNITAAGQVYTSVTGVAPGVLIGDGTTTAAFMRVRAPAGTGGAIEFMEGTATILWDIGKDYNGGTRAFTIRDAVGAKDAISIASNTSVVSFAADLSMVSGKSLYLNALHNAALFESATNVVDLWSAGTRSFAVSGGGVYLPNIGTTASAANMFTDNTNSGLISRSTSSVRYKHVTGEMSVAECREFVFSLRPVWYKSKSSIDDPDTLWPGLLAEDVAAIDDGFTMYANGRPDWVMYERIVAPLAVVVTDHENRLADFATDFDAVDQHFSEHELRILALESEVEHLTAQLAAVASSVG